MEVITLDLETRRLASECGGWSALKRGEGGCSALVLWSSALGYPRLFDDNDLSEAASMLENADVLISYNGVGFDIPVLEGLLGRKLLVTTHIDILALVWDALPSSRQKGYSLDAVATRTLGLSKTGDGIHAPALADNGRWGALFDYCLQDVLLTRKLAHFIQENGGIIDVNGDLLHLDVPDWYAKASI